jgi:RHH-type proline utilization regulon transcriptional repressor/proline dehydrogenase/delta 1-pyrroline-5-carboxylate dehydrogenase
LTASGRRAEAERCVGFLSRSPLGARAELPGPVGERNIYTLRRRGRIAAVAPDASATLIQIGAILASGNDAVVAAEREAALRGLPPEFAHRIEVSGSPLDAPDLAGALVAGDADAIAEAARRLAARPGPIVRLQGLSTARLAAGEDYDLAALVEERSTTINTAAAGGNASLMAIG